MSARLSGGDRGGGLVTGYSVGSLRGLPGY